MSYRPYRFAAQLPAGLVPEASKSCISRSIFVVSEGPRFGPPSLGPVAGPFAGFAELWRLFGQGARLAYSEAGSPPAAWIHSASVGSRYPLLRTSQEPDSR